MTSQDPRDREGVVAAAAIAIYMKATGGTEASYARLAPREWGKWQELASAAGSVFSYRAPSVPDTVTNAPVQTACREILKILSALCTTAPQTEKQYAADVLPRDYVMSEVLRIRRQVDAISGALSPPWPKREDITADMRSGFERLYAVMARANHETLARNDQGAYRILSVDADWVFYQRAWADALAACAVPAGSRLVPANPTQEMIDAGDQWAGVKNCYLAMLAAAPTLVTAPTAEEAKAYWGPTAPDAAPVKPSGDLAYLLACVETHADKFPVPSDMRAIAERLRGSMQASQVPYHPV